MTWRRWTAFGAIGLLQLCLFYLAGAAYRLGANDAPGGWGELPGLLLHWELLRDVGGWAAVVVLLQAVVLWPVRQPTAARKAGWSVKASLGVAAACIALLVSALLLALLELFDAYDEGLDVITLGLGVDEVGAFIGFMLIQWAVFTPLLIVFVKPRRREAMLARLAAKLFIGTMVEVAAIIPIDVMVRRRESCYCWSGTYYALMMCGTIGAVMMGPAIFLPLLSKRRKRWYRDRCDACGYDRAGLEGADRCPECGAGWRRNAPESGSSRTSGPPGSADA